MPSNIELLGKLFYYTFSLVPVSRVSIQVCDTTHTVFTQNNTGEDRNYYVCFSLFIYIHFCPDPVVADVVALCDFFVFLFFVFFGRAYFPIKI